MAPATEGVNVEEAALGRGASGTDEAVNRTTSLVHDGPAFLIYPVDYRKDNRRGR